MINHKTCEYIVTNSESIEAAIMMSGSGLALAWHSKKDTPVDEIVSICSGLLGAAGELNLFDTGSDALMMFETAFGALMIRTIDPDSLLVLCLAEGYSVIAVNRLLRQLFYQKR